MNHPEWVNTLRDRYRRVHEPAEQLARAPFDERRVENILRPKTGNVRVEPRDSPEVQKAQAFVWSLHLIDSAFGDPTDGWYSK